MSEQEMLFEGNTLSEEANGRPHLTPRSTLPTVLEAFELHMRDEGFAINTIKAFASDVRLLTKYISGDKTIGQIKTEDLNNFLNWLLYERGVPCGPKSYARRVTTLKVMFAWLHEEGVLPTNPAEAVIQQSVTSPLPTLPNEEEIQLALQASQQMWEGVEGKKPDARPHLLLTLLLQTGIKKGEAMSIVPSHIDRDNEDGPILFIRYANPRMKYKERKIPLDPNWLAVFDAYLEQYNPPDTLFTCTARNLEYVLRDVGDLAGLERGLLSFENLRWVSALQDYKSQVMPDDIRQKLGLSKITWRETKSKLDKLIQLEKEAEETENSGENQGE